MAALYSGHCYSTALEASAAYWSDIQPVITGGSSPVITMAEYDGHDWLIVSRQSGSVLSSEIAVSPDFYPCDQAAIVADGAGFGFAVVSVWATIWAVSVLRTALFR